jgi:hypothetical protein
MRICERISCWSDACDVCTHKGRSHAQKLRGDITELSTLGVLAGTAANLHRPVIWPRWFSNLTTDIVGTASPPQQAIQVCTLSLPQCASKPPGA